MWGTLVLSLVDFLWKCPQVVFSAFPGHKVSVGRTITCVQPPDVSQWKHFLHSQRPDGNFFFIFYQNPAIPGSYITDADNWCFLWTVNFPSGWTIATTNQLNPLAAHRNFSSPRQLWAWRDTHQHTDEDPLSGSPTWWCSWLRQQELKMS